MHTNNNSFIKINFFRPGSCRQIIKLDTNSTLADLKKTISTKKKNGVFFVNGNESNDNLILKNDDYIILAFSIIGGAQIKVSNNKWSIHQNDKDKLFPSDFHAHEYSKNIKLDLYTGEMYQLKRFIGKYKKKRYYQLLKELAKIEAFKKKAELILITMKKQDTPFL